MRISRVDAFQLRAELERPFGFSQFQYFQREAMLVRLSTDDGRQGWGEAYGPAGVTALIIRRFLGPLVLGMDPRAVESIWELLYARSLDYGQKGVMLAAISALDIACWDLKAQDAGLPLYRALGGAAVDSIECYWTGFYFGGDEPLERRWEREARACLDAGFRALKMKVGQGIARDAELVGALRGYVGSGVKLSIDANHAYSPVEAVRLARAVEPHGIHWFEEPVSPLDPEAYLEVKSRTSIPLAGGECEYTRFGFDRWFRLRALDFAQPDICACGGITEGMKIAATGSLTGVHVTPHAWGSAVGQAAALHFYAARPRQPFTLTTEEKLIECDRTENPFRTEIVERPIRLDQGAWALPKAPGLGLRLRTEAFEPFLVTGGV
ncbi:MAG: mandelate racemase/muconate lactonizing enzyme family protein [Bryobacterales bacterium]|nr:mandelate racemase/muconate lactonizing enzyme family protein [Bryobacterales bacterium]